jgi:hypothetical protein
VRLCACAHSQLVPMFKLFFPAYQQLYSYHTCSCRYTGDERRAKEDQLYNRLNEPVKRLTAAILKLRRRIKTANMSVADTPQLQRQVHQPCLYLLAHSCYEFPFQQRMVRENSLLPNCLCLYVCLLSDHHVIANFTAGLHYGS